MYAGAGILTGYPSVIPFGFTLGPPNPWLIVIAKETLDLRTAAFSAALWLLMPTFSLPPVPFRLTTGLHNRRDAPLPRAINKLLLNHIFGIEL